PPYVFGLYEMPFDLNGDSRLYLFPSLEYAVTWGCDVCEERTLELGTWSFMEGVVKLSPTRHSTEDDFLNSRVFRHIGDFHTLRFFVTADGEFIGDSVLVSPEKLDAGPLDHVEGLIRRQKYPDWPEKLRDLRQRMPSDNGTH